jgi:hypothetical protein
MAMDKRSTVSAATGKQAGQLELSAQGNIFV